MSRLCSGDLKVLQELVAEGLTNRGTFIRVPRDLLERIQVAVDPNLKDNIRELREREALETDKKQEV